MSFYLHKPHKIVRTCLQDFSNKKFEKLKDDIVVKGVLGRVIVYVQVFKFQKKGLSHAHMLIILDEVDKLHTPEDYDRVTKAEILCKEEQPQLHKVVLKHMIHDPC